jgi:release factor glutamine methyltransferase
MDLKIYEPQEDSFLLREQVIKYSKGRVLDMGTGSGIQAIAASRKAGSVLAVDIDSYSLEFAESQAKASGVSNVSFRKSDLFSKVKEKFDLIIFNPPYLPKQEGEHKSISRQVSGGKKGYELLGEFFSQADAHLEKNGKILIVFSSLTNKNKVDEIIERYGFDFVIISKSGGLEALYIYEVRRGGLLDRFVALGISDVEKFAKGHRGVIYKARFKKKVVAIKTKLSGSEAVGNIERESEWLRLLNQKGIGPKLIQVEDDYFIYEFIEGVFIKDFIPKANKEKIKKVLKEVIRQCFVLDKLKINKEEMHHPIKHIIINKKITLIDFERANKTINPHNVNQFCQYIINQGELLSKKGFRIDREKLISLAKSYKEDINMYSLDNILKALK